MSPMSEQNQNEWKLRDELAALQARLKKAGRMAEAARQAIGLADFVQNSASTTGAQNDAREIERTLRAALADWEGAK